MPIDQASFRPSQEGGNVEEVWRWQELRYANEDAPREAVRVLLDNLERWDLERRSILRKLNESRAAVKSMQRSLAPAKSTKGKKSKGNHVEDETELINNNVDEARTKMKELKQKIIPNLEESLEEIEARIEDSLPRIANSVDTELFLDLDEGDSDSGASIALSENKGNVSENTVIDPLFCLGGYEFLHVNNAQKITVLTGIGAALARALSQRAMSFLSEEETSPSYTPPPKQVAYQQHQQQQTRKQLIHLPKSITIDASLAHSLWGCIPSTSPTATNSSCGICKATSTDENSTLEAPPLIAFSMLHRKQTYHDRQLPLLFVSQTTATTTTTNSLDERCIGTRTRAATTPKSGSSTKNNKGWMERLPPHDGKEQIELLALTVCNLVESRKMQKEIAHQMVAFHESLLVQKETTISRRFTSTSNTAATGAAPSNNSNTIKRQFPSIRTRLVPPTCLLPCEVSRIVMEGYLPRTGEYTILGYVSNFTDYLARGCRTKCGVMDVEFVHTVHGVLCSIPHTMEWMLEHNAVASAANDNNNNGGGVRLAMSLIPHLRVQVGLQQILNEDVVAEWNATTSNNANRGDCLFWPFQRRLQQGKNGRVTVEEIKAASQPRIELGNTNEQTVEESTRSKTIGVSKEAVPQTTQTGIKKNAFALIDRMPSQQEIRDEARTNPHAYFLPLGL